MLQEWAQARGLPTPIYREIARTGPHHDPEFRVAAELPGRPSAEGLGRSKRAAEQAAAASMLAREGVAAQASPTGALTEGAASEGAATEGAATDGAATDGAATEPAAGA
jgi:hypothetical protein